MGKHCLQNKKIKKKKNMVPNTVYLCVCVHVGVEYVVAKYVLTLLSLSRVCSDKLLNTGL